MKYNVGDRVVVNRKPFFDFEKSGEVTGFRLEDSDLLIIVLYDDGTEDEWESGPWIELESIYNSPLYKALK